jgi:hypothetical protein
MNNELLVEVMKHYIRCSNSSKDNSSLPILDNYQSHLSTEVMDVAKDNGVNILTPPPHPTHILKKFQPLDVGLFSRFKHYHSALKSKILHTKAIHFQ